MEGAFQKALKMKFTVTVELLIRPWVQRTQLTSWILVIFFFSTGAASSRGRSLGGRCQGSVNYNFIVVVVVVFVLFF